MSLEELMRLIEALKERIGRHATVLRESETRTRMALIDPILDALGWHVHDPELVVGEYRVGDGRADYALMGGEGKPLAVVEAKKLGADLTSYRAQMLNYAVAAGIQYAALTDGNNWEAYKVFEPVPLEDKRVLRVSIFSDPASATALRLLLLWRPNLGTGSPVQAKVPNGEPDPPPSPPPPPKWIPLATYDPKPHTSCPRAIRYWDGSSQRLERWYQVLTFVVEKLHNDRMLTQSDLPVMSTGKTCIANSEPRHPDGRRFKDSTPVANSAIFVNTNLNAKQVRQNARRMLRRFHKDPASVMLQVTD